MYRGKGLATAILMLTCACSSSGEGPGDLDASDSTIGDDVTDAGAGDGRDDKGTETRTDTSSSDVHVDGSDVFDDSRPTETDSGIDVAKDVSEEGAGDLDALDSTIGDDVADVGVDDGCGDVGTETRTDTSSSDVIEDSGSDETDIGIETDTGIDTMTDVPEDDGVEVADTIDASDVGGGDIGEDVDTAPTVGYCQSAKGPGYSVYCGAGSTCMVHAGGGGPVCRTGLPSGHPCGIIYCDTGCSCSDPLASICACL